MKSTFFASFVSAFFASQAFALPVYLKNLNDFYKDNGIDVSPITTKYKCATCHNSASGGSRNVFGQDVGKSIKSGAGFSGMEFQDSDNDGTSNLEELFSGSAPALDSENATSRLEVKFDATQASNGAFIVSGQTEKCSDFTIRSFGLKVIFPNTTGFVDSGSFDASSTPSLVLPLEAKDSKGAILVKCVEEKKVGSFQLK